MPEYQAPSQKVRAQSERLLNLLFALRNDSQWVDRQTLRMSIRAYRDLSESAFERQFERDKATLRSIGVEISTRDWTDPVSEVVTYGYRISNSDYQLGELELSFDEAVVASVARSLMAGVAGTGPVARAFTKLAGLGPERMPNTQTIVPQTPLASQNFARTVTAVDELRPVQFTYRKPGGTIEVRRVNPYAVSVRGNRAYVIGFDLDREEERIFRMNRILGEMSIIPGTRKGSYSIPVDFDARALIDRANASSADNVTVRVRPNHAWPLRHRALSTNGDVLTVAVGNLDTFVTELLSYSDAVEVISPPEFVEAFAQARTETWQALRRLAQGETSDS